MEEPMFDHVGLPVSDFARSVSFYRAALEPLGYGLESHDAQARSAGFGRPGAPQLWLSPGRTGGALHLAFQTPDRASVQRFYTSAIEAGGKDNGKPGPRPSYGETYYAAFVLDPDGHNIEAVCLRPEKG
jgi:catechol 2,3-dioxygenase-like lactoylglutathione lyase family enzyme